MFRILPVLMVALGLFLAVTSFASANTPEGVEAGRLDVCAEVAEHSVALLDQPARSDLARCWRTVGMGVPVPACQIEKGVTAATEKTVPRNDVGWPETVTAQGHDTPAPLTDVPPPKS
jgi:hypothetical protein